MACHSDDAIRAGAAEYEARFRQGHDEISPLNGHGLFNSGPDGVLRRKQQSQERLACPILRPMTGIGLNHRREFLIPPASQKAVANRAALHEVAKNSTRDTAGFARTELRRVEKSARPKRSSRCKSICQRPPMVERSSVCGKEVSILVEVLKRSTSVDSSARRIALIAVHAAPQQREEVNSPADVVVKTRARTIAVPAVSAIPRIDQL